jgi:hypothetical protein
MHTPTQGTNVTETKGLDNWDLTYDIGLQTKTGEWVTFHKGCPYSRVVAYVTLEATVGFEGCLKLINPRNYYTHHHFTSKNS